MSTHGYPDFQRYAQWIGAPLAEATGFAIGAGSHTYGPFPVNNWASVVLCCKPTGGSISATIRQTISGGPAGLIDDTVVTIPSGATTFESFVLLGSIVSLILAGNTAGETVDFALLPSNTTVQTAQTTGGTTPTGTVLAYAGAVAPSGYLICDGSLLDGTNATYAALWAVVGTTYGGSGQASFALPDLRGRAIVAKGTNASVNALGTSDGVAVANRRPQHQHTKHTHAITPAVISATAGATGGAAANLIQLVAATQPADGGSGVATDPLDAGAFLVLNYIIAL